MGTFQLSIKLLIMISAGFAMVKLRALPNEPEKTLTSVILNFVVPCVIIKSLMAVSIRESYQLALQLALCGVAYSVFSFGAAQLLYCLMGKGTGAKVIRFGVIFTNFTYFGLPVVEVLFGEFGVFAFTLFTLPIRILYYITPSWLLGEHKQDLSAAKRIKAFFTPPFCAVIIGIVFSALEVRLPEVLVQTMAAISPCCTPLGMLLCGLVLGRFQVEELLRLRYLRLPLIRNILFPLVIFGLLRIIQLQEITEQMIFLYSCLPVGSFLIVYAVRYVTDEKALQEASASLLFSTLLAVITVPVWMNLYAV